MDGRSDFHFSSLFTVNSEETDTKFNAALKMFHLQDIVKVVNVERNLEKLRKNGLISKAWKNFTGPEGSVVVDVPGKGDCWLAAIFSLVLGEIPDVADPKHIVRTVRRWFVEIVKADWNKFSPIFDGKREDMESWASIMLTPWTSAHNRWKYGGSKEFEIFARATGICVHVLRKPPSKSKYSQRVTAGFIPPVTHHLPVDLDKETRKWNVSVVVAYDSEWEHYSVVIPKALPTRKQITFAPMRTNLFNKVPINIESEHLLEDASSVDGCSSDDCSSDEWKMPARRAPCISSSSESSSSDVKWSKVVQKNKLKKTTMKNKLSDLDVSKEDVLSKNKNDATLNSPKTSVKEDVLSKNKNDAMLNPSKNSLKEDVKSKNKSYTTLNSSKKMFSIFKHKERVSVVEDTGSSSLLCDERTVKIPVTGRLSHFPNGPFRCLRCVLTLHNFKLLLRFII